MAPATREEKVPLESLYHRNTATEGHIFNPKNSMKKISIIRLRGLMLALCLAPIAANAQTTTENPSGSDQNSKAVPNAGDANSGSVNSPSSADANSKTPTQPLDSNPSMNSTGSADKSATKDSGALSTEKKKTASTKDSGKLTDKAFVMKAAQGGMTEVELGKIAESNGSSDDVKTFGSHMVMDHGKANDELKSIAEQKSIAIPSALDAKHQATVDKFKHLSGAAFDKAYVNEMVKDHKMDASLFREESTTAQDPELKTFATNTLTVVESHLTDIKGIQSKMK
jgi:putative membrane protein